MKTNTLKQTHTNKNKYGFTLVELIVVITILVILGTIAFTSLGGYSSSARDSSRVSDFDNLKKSLQLTYVKTGSFPTPTNGTGVTFSGGTVWTQGSVGDSVINILSSAGFKFSKKPTDPKYPNIEYTYSLLNTGKEYQIGMVVEDNTTAYNESNNTSFIPQTYAATTDNLVAYIGGNYNGLVAKVQTGSTTYYLTLPSIILSNLTNGTELTNVATQSGNLVLNKQGILPSTYPINGITSTAPSIKFSALATSSGMTNGSGIVAYSTTGSLNTAGVSVLMSNIYTIYNASSPRLDATTAGQVNNLVTAGSGSTVLINTYNGTLSTNIAGTTVSTTPSYEWLCGAPDIKVGNQYWAACNVGARSIFTGYHPWADDSPVATETTAGKNFQWGENVAWNYDGGTGSADNCTWNRDTQSCGASALSVWLGIVSDNLSTGIPRWYDWSMTDNRGPCAVGYHVPTQPEWDIAFMTLGSDDSVFIATLKLAQAGGRFYWNNGVPDEHGQNGYYSHSSYNGVSMLYILGGSIFTSEGNHKDNAISVRCIRN